MYQNIPKIERIREKFSKQYLLPIKTKNQYKKDLNLVDQKLKNAIKQLEEELIKLYKQKEELLPQIDYTDDDNNPNPEIYIKSQITVKSNRVDIQDYTHEYKDVLIDRRAHKLLEQIQTIKSSLESLKDIITLEIAKYLVDYPYKTCDDAIKDVFPNPNSKNEMIFYENKIFHFKLTYCDGKTNMETVEYIIKKINDYIDTVLRSLQPVESGGRKTRRKSKKRVKTPPKRKSRKN